MMKKSIFAVAVASVLTLGAAQAETILYGSLRYDYENKKNEHAELNQTTGKVKFSGKSLSNLSDAGSRIGIKGSEDLGNNNAVIYNIEYGFDGMSASEDQKFKIRKAILGLTGDWGTFTAGRQDNPFKVTIVDDTIVDEFNASNVITSASQRAMTSTLNGTGLAEVRAGIPANKEPAFVFENSTIADSEYSRVGKVIAYTTPDFAGFSANVALMMDDTKYAANNQKNIDLWTINAKYDYDFGADGTLTAKAGYIQGQMGKDGHVGNYNKGKSQVWGLFLGYSQDAFGVTANYASGTYKDDFQTAAAKGPKHKSQGWDVGARYSFGANYFSSVRATYGQNTVKVNGTANTTHHGKDKVKSWAVGFEQKLSTRTRAWVEYGNEETTFAHKDIDKRKDNVISVGMRHDF